MHHRFIRSVLTWALAAAGLLLISSFANQANAQTPADQTPADKTLPVHTRFFVPQPASGSIQQAVGYLEKGQLKDALLIAAMESTPQAVWLTGNTPAETASTVTKTLGEANFQRAIPIYVLYNIPGRDCGSYSAGGAENTADYEAWIDAIAGAIGDRKAVVLLEPDAIADLPSDCGYDPTRSIFPRPLPTVTRSSTTPSHGSSSWPRPASTSTQATATGRPFPSLLSV